MPVRFQQSESKFNRCNIPWIHEIANMCQGQSRGSFIHVYFIDHYNIALFSPLLKRLEESRVVLENRS